MKRLGKHIKTSVFTIVIRPTFDYTQKLVTIMVTQHPPWKWYFWKALRGWMDWFALLSSTLLSLSHRVSIANTVVGGKVQGTTYTHWTLAI
jgi:hypothetical protein